MLVLQASALVATYVALLRAINVGSRNKIAMPALRAVFEALGHSDVTTYVQSGNVVFKATATTGAKDQAAVAAGIEHAITEEFGHDVRVLLRTRADLARVTKAHPFATDGADSKFLHVTFLSGAPNKASVRAIDADAFGSDRFAVAGREVYLLCPGGYGNSKLNNAFWERKLRLVATTRNWNTVTKLRELAGA